MDFSLFDQVGDLVYAMTPEELGEVKLRSSRRGIKVWFDSEDAPRMHYEAQQLPRRHVDGIEGIAIEIGFHAEERDVAVNEQVVAKIAKSEKKWRKILGDEPSVGEFFNSTTWRRVSEAWIEPDFDDPELAFEIGSRLVDYLTAIEGAR